MVSKSQDKTYIRSRTITDSNCVDVDCGRFGDKSNKKTRDRRVFRCPAFPSEPNASTLQHEAVTETNFMDFCGRQQPPPARAEVP